MSMNAVHPGKSKESVVETRILCVFGAKRVVEFAVLVMIWMLVSFKLYNAINTYYRMCGQTH
jgi:hypothetical protein